jgi:hypothetical protein
MTAPYGHHQSQFIFLGMMSLPIDRRLQIAQIMRWRAASQSPSIHSGNSGSNNHICYIEDLSIALFDYTYVESEPYMALLQPKDFHNTGLATQSIEFGSRTWGYRDIWARCMGWDDHLNFLRRQRNKPGIEYHLL